MTGLFKGLKLRGVKLRQNRSPVSLTKPGEPLSSRLGVGDDGGQLAALASSNGDADVMAIPPIIHLGYKGERYKPQDWIEKYFYDPTTVNMFGKDWDFSAAQTLKLEITQKRILEKVFTIDQRTKTFPYSTIVYSTIKKEGKTTLAGAVGAWWTAQVAPPDLTLCLANDQEQSAGRIFGAMLPTYYKLNGGRGIPMAMSSKPEIRVPNGSIIQAIANNYAGNAGANYGLTLWSELWAYTTERSRRLYDELVPVPTKQHSIRWIETYVGFEDESDLLLKLFKRIFTDTDESGTQPNARPVPGLEDIQSEGKPCCWHIPEEKLFYFHNHTPRMGPIWTTPEAYEAFRRAQKADLRHEQYVRLWENRWQASQGNLLLPEEYDDACTLLGPDPTSPMILAGDASQRNDHIALVGVRKYFIEVHGELQERYKLVYCSVWDPKIHGAQRADKRLGTKKGDMDLEETVAREVARLYNQGRLLGPFRYDPAQMHQVAVNLRKKQIPCVEFSQQSERLKSDTFLLKLMKKGLFDMYYHSTLEKHFKNAKAKEYENEQIRIVKGTISRSSKVDGAVAAAMAVYAASKFREQHSFDSSESFMGMR